MGDYTVRHETIEVWARRWCRVEGIDPDALLTAAEPYRVAVAGQVYRVRDDESHCRTAVSIFADMLRKLDDLGILKDTPNG